MTTPAECSGQWGCTCPVCSPRQHPMDRIARFTEEQKQAWHEEALAIAALPKRAGCISCGAPGTHRAGHGIRCDSHLPTKLQAPGELPGA